MFRQLIMKPFQIFSFVLFVIILIMGCSKETTPTLTYPATFKFNTPSLEDRSVFTIDSSYVLDPATNTKKLVWKFTRLGEGLGSYDKSNEEIADTLNYLIRKNFTDVMISNITLLSSTQMEIEYSKLIIKDTLNPLLDQIEFLNKMVVDYQQVGNFLGNGIYINNDFKEIFICNEFILATKRLNATTTFKEYFQNDCNGVDPETSLNNFVTNINTIKFDTASVEYVNYIFSSYK